MKRGLRSISAAAPPPSKRVPELAPVTAPQPQPAAPESPAAEPPAPVENVISDPSDVRIAPDLRLPPGKAPARSYKFKLDKFQSDAAQHLEDGHSVLVAAHTSAGKTVVAEYAIGMCIRDRKRVVYTSPIKALSNQKFRDFTVEFSGSLSVGLMTGDVTINPDADLIVMTTEILRSMLFRGSATLREIGFVIFDEVHYLRDPARGVVWEETLILLPPTMQFVFLSATIPNTDEFASWVEATHDGMRCPIVYTDYRPTPLRHYVAPLGHEGLVRVVDDRGNFAEDAAKDAIDMAKRAKDAHASASSPQGGAGGDGGGGGRGRGGGGGGRGRGRGKDGGDAGDRLAQYTWDIIKSCKSRGLLPAIVFSFSRKQCGTLAAFLQKKIAKRGSGGGTGSDAFASAADVALIETVWEGVMASLSESDRDLPCVQELLPLLKAGIGVHHGGMLPILRETVEILFGADLLRVLLATETFAMGINMPAKTVVFTSLLKFDGEGERLLRSGEYIQMAGRAGRRGLDEFGFVITIADHRQEVNELRKVMDTTPDVLNSSYRLTFCMILNLIRVESHDPMYIVARSFAQHQRMRSAPTDRATVLGLRAAAAAIAVPPTVQAAVSSIREGRRVAAECAARVRIEETRASAIMHDLRAGRAVDIEGWGWCVILRQCTVQRESINAAVAVGGPIVRDAIAILSRGADGDDGADADAIAVHTSTDGPADPADAASARRAKIAKQKAAKAQRGGAGYHAGSFVGIEVVVVAAAPVGSAAAAPAPLAPHGFTLPLPGGASSATAALEGTRPVSVSVPLVSVRAISGVSVGVPATAATQRPSLAECAKVAARLAALGDAVVHAIVPRGGDAAALARLRAGVEAAAVATTDGLAALQAATAVAEAAVDNAVVSRATTAASKRGIAADAVQAAGRSRGQPGPGSATVARLLKERFSAETHAEVGTPPPQQAAVDGAPAALQTAVAAYGGPAAAAEGARAQTWSAVAHVAAAAVDTIDAATTTVTAEDPDAETASSPAPATRTRARGRGAAAASPTAGDAARSASAVGTPAALYNALAAACDAAVGGAAAEGAKGGDAAMSPAAADKDIKAAAVVRAVTAASPAAAIGDSDSRLTDMLQRAAGLACANIDTAAMEAAANNARDIARDAAAAALAVPDAIVSVGALVASPSPKGGAGSALASIAHGSSAWKWLVRSAVCDGLVTGAAKYEREAAQRTGLLLVDELQAMLRVLRRLQFVSGSGALLVKGRAACEISNDGLLLASLLVDGAAGGLSAPALATVLCALGESKTSDPASKIEALSFPDGDWVAASGPQRDSTVVQEEVLRGLRALHRIRKEVVDVLLECGYEDDTIAKGGPQRFGGGAPAGPWKKAGAGGRVMEAVAVADTLASVSGGAASDGGLGPASPTDAIPAAPMSSKPQVSNVVNSFSVKCVTATYMWTLGASFRDVLEACGEAMPGELVRSWHMLSETLRQLEGACKTVSATALAQTCAEVRVVSTLSQ